MLGASTAPPPTPPSTSVFVGFQGGGKNAALDRAVLVGPPFSGLGKNRAPE